MKELVSVIIPVYNTQKYLEACICSVLVQSYENFEVILINDGSTDQSVEICKKFEKKSEKIRFFSQENKGVSAARNVGIHYSKGKYLFFMDSDDVIHRDTLQALYCIIKKEKVEMAVAKYVQLGNEMFDMVVQRESVRKIKSEYILLENQGLFDCIGGFEPWIMTGIGGKMFSANALDNLRFRENLTHGEDTLFIYQCIQKGISAVILQENIYYYRIHEKSASHTFWADQYLEHIEVCKYIRDCEYMEGRTEHALVWEDMCMYFLEKYYSLAKKQTDKKLCRRIKNTARMYWKEPIFHEMVIRKKFLFVTCFTCYPIYFLKQKLVYIIGQLRRK